MSSTRSHWQSGCVRPQCGGATVVYRLWHKIDVNGAPTGGICFGVFGLYGVNKRFPFFSFLHSPRFCYRKAYSQARVRNFTSSRSDEGPKIAATLINVLWKSDTFKTEEYMFYKNHVLWWSYYMCHILKGIYTWTTVHKTVLENATQLYFSTVRVRLFQSFVFFTILQSYNQTQ